MAIITERPRVIFFHIPKAAGSSITSWLENTGKGKKIEGKHSDMHEHKDLLKEDIFSFTCVRHPYSLVPSAYYFMMKFKHFKAEKISLEDWILKDRMLEHICGKIQTEYLDMDRLDSLMRYESINTDFTEIQKLFNTEKKLPTKNIAMGDKKINLTDDMKEKIYLHYKEDFAAFNYES